MKFINQEIKKCHDEYVRLLELSYIALDELEDNSDSTKEADLEKKYDKAKKIFVDFADNVFARAIYIELSKTKPVLVDVRTGKKCKWDKLFKCSFDELDSLDKSILIGLIEETGGYTFA